MSDKKMYYLEDEVTKIEELGNDIIIVHTKTDSGLELSKKMTKARYEISAREDKESSDATKVINRLFDEALYPALREIITKYGLSLNEFELYLLGWGKTTYKNEINQALSNLIAGDARLYVPGSDILKEISLLDFTEVIEK